MSDITIDRLTLRLRGLATHDGERLARLVADGLATSAASLETPYHVGALHISGAVDLGSNMEQLANQIVADVIRQLARTI